MIQLKSIRVKVSEKICCPPKSRQDDPKQNAGNAPHQDAGQNQYRQIGKYNRSLHPERSSADLADIMGNRATDTNQQIGKTGSFQRKEQEHTADTATLNDRILSGLMEKNSRWHDAVLFAYYMDIPQERVAEMMGVRIGVLHSILHRAKVWIRKTYGVEYEEMNRKE